MPTETEINLVKNYLNNIEMYPDVDEIKTVISLSVKQDAYEHNKGIRHRRCEHNPREMAFYEAWLKENNPDPHIGSGQGILQDLFIDNPDPLSAIVGGKIIEIITNRDRMIVATVIQWLGSNCGMSFLYEALKKFNSRIVENK